MRVARATILQSEFLYIYDLRSGQVRELSIVGLWKSFPMSVFQRIRMRLAWTFLLHKFGSWIMITIIIIIIWIGSELFAKKPRRGPIITPPGGDGFNYAAATSRYQMIKTAFNLSFLPIVTQTIVLGNEWAASTPNWAVSNHQVHVKRRLRAFSLLLN